MTRASPLSLSPEQALRFFRDKLPEGSFDYRDIFGAQHATHFTVAKAMEMDVLEAFKAAIDTAKAEGKTKDWFTQELTPTLQKLGWWGRQTRVDPLDGEEKLVQLGSARRLATIYDTNLRTSYAAGRWERIQARKEAKPWLRYVCVLDGRERLAHRAWHGTVLRVDDPWWRTHYPPCGWFCRCSVQQLSDDDLAQLGYQPSAKAPDLKAQPWTNPRTGVTIRLPEGIDPGFGHNAGVAADQAARDRLIEKLDAANPPLATALIAEVMKAAPFDDFTRPGTHRTGDWPVARLTGGLARAVGSRSSVLRLSRWSADKQIDHHPEIVADDYRTIQALLDRVGAGSELLPSHKRHHSGLIGHVDGQWYRLIVKRAADGRELYIQSFHRLRPKVAAGQIKRGYAAAGGIMENGRMGGWRGSRPA